MADPRSLRIDGFLHLHTDSIRGCKRRKLDMLEDLSCRPISFLLWFARYLYCHQQACNPQTLQKPENLPPCLRQAYTCEVLLLAIALSTLAHWICLSTSFRQEHWREKHLPLVFSVVFATLIPAGWIVQDPSTLFIQIAPVVADICAVACVLVDSFALSGLDTGDDAS